MYKHVSISQQKKHVLLQWTQVKRTTLWLDAIIQMQMVSWEEGYHIWWGCVPGLMKRYHGWWERVLQGLMGVPYLMGVPGPIGGDTRLMRSGYHTQFTAGTAAISSLGLENSWFKHAGTCKMVLRCSWIEALYDTSVPRLRFHEGTSILDMQDLIGLRCLPCRSEVQS